MSRACPPAPPVEVQVIGRARVADLVIIGSHCLGLDVLIGRLQSEGISVKALNVGRTGGLGAAKRRSAISPRSAAPAAKR